MTPPLFTAWRSAALCALLGAALLAPASATAAPKAKPKPAAKAVAPGEEATPERPSKPVPALAKLKKVDGDLRDLAGALALKKVDGPTASFSARVGYKKDALILGVSLTDDALNPADALDVSLHFPEAGATARGFIYRFAVDGQRVPDPEVAAPEFAQKLVQTGVKRRDGELDLEISIPARAFPRFPAKDPMIFDLCLTYADRDDVGAAAVEASNCLHGSMAGEALKLPDEFRTALKLKPSPAAEGLEAREGGWVGFGIFHYPVWAEATEPLTPESLRVLVADQPVEPESARIALPARMDLHKQGPLFTVLSGKDPYAEEGKCDSTLELRLGVYLVKGKVANRVLEWPAATCALGRATSVELDDDDGALSIGYSNGALVNFSWSTDHFERTEIGKREP